MNDDKRGYIHHLLVPEPTAMITIPQSGEITFTCGTIEMIKLTDSGDIFVKGKLIENDKEVIEGMREFLKIMKSKDNF